jgi:hypothetical protein
VEVERKEERICVGKMASFNPRMGAWALFLQLAILKSANVFPINPCISLADKPRFSLIESLCSDPIKQSNNPMIAKCKRRDLAALFAPIVKQPEKKPGE